MIGLILLCCIADVPLSETTEWAEAIETASKANLALFPYGTLRLKYTQGDAANFEAASRGELKRARSTEMLYVFDGPHARYEWVNSIEDIVGDLSENGGPNNLRSYRLLTDGRVTLHDYMFPSTSGPGATFIHQPQIAPGSTLFYQDLLVPLHLGDPEDRNPIVRPLRHSSRQEHDLRLVSVDDGAEFDGSEVVIFAIESPRVTQKYWVDLARGAIVRQWTSILKPEGIPYIERNSDLRLVDGRGWLPFRWENLIGSFAKQMTVIEADFEHRPDRSRFGIEFESPIAMVNAADFVKYEPRKVWNLRELPRAGSSRTTPIPRPGAAPPAPPVPMPEEREPGPRWGLPLACLGGVLLILSGRRFFRRRHDH